MIELRHLYKYYAQPVLKDINITLYPGKIYVLNGTSGSGKSTLFHILGGLDNTYDGEVIYQNKSLKSMNKTDMRSYQNIVGYVFQESLLIPQFSVLENLQMFCNDEEKIEDLARHFDLYDILQQNPTNLSNGERQRISIIRTLLYDPSILLLDEPTASLDQNNAHILLQQIVKLKSEKRILLISTHDPIFQEIADVMLHMEYGTLTQVNKEQVESMVSTTNTPIVVTKKTKQLSFDVLYTFRKYQSIFKNIGFLISASFIFLLLFLSFTLKMNFEEAYEHKLEKEYPAQVFSINKKKYDKVHDQSFEMEYLKNYQKEYEEFSVKSYFPKEDSSLAIPQAIKFGSFPSLESEVVVNMEYIQKMFPNENTASILQEEIEIEGATYQISGILTEDKGILKDVYSSNNYYWDMEGPLVFMSEQAMHRVTEPKEDMVIMVKLINTKMKSDVYTELFDMGATSYFYRLLSDQLYSVNLLFFLIQICLFVIACMVFIFMYFVIQLDLFHRKRELGYLQIFHMHKKRVSNIVMIGYFLKIAAPLLVSLVGYFISIAMINHYFRLALPYDIFLVLLLVIGLNLYVFIVVKIPLHKYMKKDILTLIKE